MKNLFKGNKPIVFIAVILLIMCLTVISFAFFTPIINLGEIFSLSGTANFDQGPDFTFTELSDGISLDGTYPMTDEVGMKNAPYTFTITNNENSQTIKYKIILETKSNNTLSNELVSTNLGGVLTECKTVNVTNHSYSKAYIIKTGYLNPLESITLNLRIWINEKGTLENAKNKTWNSKVLVSAEENVADASMITLTNLGLNVNSGTPDFNYAATTDEGIFKMIDDYGDSYYFRGAVENNYVKFAGFYWRIIRINGDGSLRIMYDGTQAYPNNDETDTTAQEIINPDRYIAYSSFNDDMSENYMIGLDVTPSDEINKRCLKLVNEEISDISDVYTSKISCNNAGGTWTLNNTEAINANIKDSLIKSKLDEWYQLHIIENGYETAVSDTLFCHDRSKIYSIAEDSGEEKITFKSYERLVKNKNPQLTCNQQNDSFTVNDINYGNGDLTYPVGLITADELALAGAKTSESGTFDEIDETAFNKSYYLYKSMGYFSMTPYDSTLDDPPRLFGFWFETSRAVNTYLRGNHAVSELAVIPVINLTPEYVSGMIGDGTIGNEFRVE